jgi:hypothetical protein
MTTKNAPALMRCVSAFWSHEGACPDGTRVSEDSPLYRNHKEHFISDGLPDAEINAARAAKMYPGISAPPPPPSPFLPPERTRRCVVGCQMTATGSVSGLWIASPGDILAETNPLVRKWPDCFEKVTA